MKINVDTVNPWEHAYMMTEQRELWRIARSLMNMGVEVSTIPYEYVKPQEYDVCVWSHQPIIPVVKNRVGDAWNDTINVLFAHGDVLPGDNINGVIYVIRQGYEDSASFYKYSIYIHPPFEPLFRLDKGYDDYILTGGALIPKRSMHVTLLALTYLKVNNMVDNIPKLKIVYQPSKEWDWSDRDKGGLYRKMYDAIFNIAIGSGIEIEEQDAICYGDFQILLSRAKCYINLARGVNTTICQESIAYGVPLLSFDHSIDYTNDYIHIIRQSEEYEIVMNLASLIKDLLINYSSIKESCMKNADASLSKCSYRQTGTKLLDFFLEIAKDKYDGRN